MTREEAKEIFLNRGYVTVLGGSVFDGDLWRRSLVVISEWLKEQEPCENDEKEEYSEETNGLAKYAMEEMARLGWMNEDTDPMQKEMVRCVLELIRVFNSQGHSGFSAPYCLNLFNRLASWRPISPLTGEDDEWNDIDANLCQNKRYSAVFKDKGTGRVYDSDGKVFTIDNGETWYSCRDSSVDITFPYTVPDKPEEVYLYLKSEDKE